MESVDKPSHSLHNPPVDNSANRIPYIQIGRGKASVDLGEGKGKFAAFTKLSTYPQALLHTTES